MKHRSVVCSFLLLGTSARAADLSGSFVAESNSAISLELRESPPGTVTGTVHSPMSEVSLRARRTGSELRGTMGDADEQVAIRLLPDGDRLRLEPLEGPNRQVHVFRRAAKASAAKSEAAAAAGRPGGVTIISRPDGSMTIIEPTPPVEAAVIVNGRRLSPAEVARLERTYGVQVRPADYWYDRMTGAWGIRGGPTRGFILPGLELGGGRLAPDASGGGTGVFVNGRELHPDEVAALRTCLPVQTGRWWVLANGLVGREGGPAMFNMSVCARQGSGGGGLDCEGASCGTWRTRTGATGYTGEGGGQGAVHYNGQLIMTPN